MTKRIASLFLLVAIGGVLLVVTPRRAGANPNNANCKPNRASCTSNHQCCSGVCTAGLCAAPGATTTTTTPTTTTIISTTTTTSSTTTTTQRFVDNMNGTITDKQTGLQWEKKDTTCPGIHCVDDIYSWCVGSDDFTCVNGGVPDGTAFTSFLRTLNGGDTGVGNCTVSDDTTPPQAGFAGHCPEGHVQAPVVLVLPDLTAVLLDDVRRPVAEPGRDAARPEGRGLDDVVIDAEDLEHGTLLTVTMPL